MEAPRRSPGKRVRLPGIRQVRGYPVLTGFDFQTRLDVRSGETLLEHNVDRLFSPASVNKLLTAAATLWRLGPAFQWQTPLATSAPRTGAREEVLAGDLWAMCRGAPDTVEEQIWVAATEGLRWPLENEALTRGRTRGLSNEMLSGEARIDISEGKGLIVHLAGA